MDDDLDSLGTYRGASIAALLGSSCDKAAGRSRVFSREQLPSLLQIKWVFRVCGPSRVGFGMILLI